MKCILSLLFTAFAFPALAQTEPPFKLETLDVLKTCKLGTIQETNAQLAMSYVNAHRWWNMKDQIGMHHPEYMQWHGSLAGVLAADPSSNDKVPFKNGVITSANWIKTFAYVAFLNDITKYHVKIDRLDCLGDDTVIMTTRFEGFQVRRDQNGCITHGLKYGSPGYFEFRFKDFKADASSRTQRLLYRGFTYLDANYSIGVKAALATLAKGPPNVVSNPANCKTYETLVREFQSQLEN